MVSVLLLVVLLLLNRYRLPRYGFTTGAQTQSG